MRLPRGVGIDTIRVSFPFDGWFSPPHFVGAWRIGSPHESSTIKALLGGGGRVTARGSTAGVASAEVSLPRYRYGNNRVFLDASEVPSVLEDVLDEIRTHLSTSVTVADLHVDRLDIGRDFHGVSDVSALLGWFGASDFGPRCHVYLHRNSEPWETLQIGAPSSWTLRLYDKGAEQGIAGTGWLRYELQLRKRLQSRWAQRHGGKIMNVRDITAGGVENLARSEFDHRRLSASFVSLNDLVGVVLGDPTLSDAEQRNLITFFSCEAVGQRPPISARTLDGIRMHAERLGLRLRPPGAAAGCRLDWTTGTEVAA